MLPREACLDVRLTAENQLFLDTRRPTRLPITAAILESLVPGFKSRKPSLFRINYQHLVACTYHLYEGGGTWVPTVPGSIAKPGERFGVELELLTTEAFLRDFPIVSLGSRRDSAWMANRAQIKTITKPENKVSLIVHQNPQVEGISDFQVNGELVEGLRFQTGSVFATVRVLDVFSRPTLIQLHHNGHKKAWLSRKTRASARIQLFSFDGVRLRILYHLSKGNSSTVVYMQRPSVLFRLGAIEDFPRGIEPAGLQKEFQVRGVELMRPLERDIIKRGGYYETGRIGAEICYKVVTERLGVKDLILNEPARGGTDLFTGNRRVLVESRFIAGKPSSKLSEQIVLELVRMARRLRNDFRWNPGAEVGYAILSYNHGGTINTLVAKMSGFRWEGAARGI